MNIVVLDLEWNGAYSRKLHGFINEIIEFGAVKLDKKLNIADRFSCFVRPQVTKKISTVISDLTSITDENLTDAMPFMQVVSRFRKWAGDCVIATWGTSDILALIENCRYFGGSEIVPFLSRYADMQVYCEQMLGLDGKEQLGLSRAAELAGVDDGQLDHHRALDDSVLSALVLKKLYTRESFRPHVQDCTDPEFYRRITFKTNYICDPESPLIERQHLRFTCEKCGGEAKRRGKWSVKNKSLRATFRCARCGWEFCGQVRVKQKYEGITVTKKTIPLPKIEKPRKAEPMQIENMQLKIEAGVGLLVFDAWENLPVTHAFSTRIGGVSRNEFAAMNLGFGRGDSDENVAENFRRIAAALQIPAERITAGAQDHHTVVRRVTMENAGVGIWQPKDMESVDGLVTGTAALPPLVYCAACGPLYFYDPKHRAIGLSHAGWRGTVGGMAKATVEKMQAEFGTDPADLLAAIGPSISKRSFEVDEPCAAEFLALPESDAFVTDDGNGKFHVDLWECNRRFMLACGVRPENITVGGVCSMENSDLVFSHRVTRGKRGSNAAFLMLRGDAE